MLRNYKLSLIVGIVLLLSFAGIGRSVAQENSSIIKEFSFGENQTAPLSRAVLSENGKWAVIRSAGRTFIWDVENNKMNTLPDDFEGYSVTNDGFVVGKTDDSKVFYGKFSKPDDYKVLTKNGDYGIALGASPDGKYVVGAKTNEGNNWHYLPCLWEVGESDVKEVILPKAKLKTKYGILMEECVAMSLSNDGALIGGMYSDMQYGVDGFSKANKLCGAWKRNASTGEYEPIELYDEFFAYGVEPQDGKYCASENPIVSANGKYVAGTIKGKGLFTPNELKGLFTFVYDTEANKMHFMGNQKPLPSASGQDNIPTAVTNDGMVLGYSGESGLVWNTQSIYGQVGESQMGTLSDYFAKNNMQYPELYVGDKQADMVGAAAEGESDLLLLMFTVKEKSNPTYRIVSMKKGAPAPDPDPEPDPDDNAPIPGAKQIATDVWQKTMSLGGKDALLFLKGASLMANYTYSFLNFGQIGGVAVWDIAHNKTVESKDEEKMHATTVASDGTIGGQLDVLPAVGKVGNWKKLAIDDNRYGSVEALSENGKFAAGWSCINESNVCTAHVWSLADDKRFDLPLPTMDELGALLTLPKPVAISEDGHVVLANTFVDDKQVAVLWVFNAQTNKYEYVDLHKGFINFADPDENLYTEAVAANLSPNGKWACGTVSGKFSKTDPAENKYGFVYDVEHRSMQLMRMTDEQKNPLPVQLFDIADNGIVVGAQVAFGGTVDAQPIYGDATRTTNELYHISKLFKEKGVENYSFGEHGALVEAISGNAQAIVLYEILGGEKDFHKQVSVIYFGKLIQDAVCAQSALSLRVYPTETTGLLNIERTTAQPTICRVFTLEGQQAYATEIATSASHIDLSHLSAGIYFVVVEGQTIKIIKK